MLTRTRFRFLSPSKLTAKSRKVLKKAAAGSSSSSSKTLRLRSSASTSALPSGTTSVGSPTKPPKRLKKALRKAGGKKTPLKAGKHPARRASTSSVAERPNAFRDDDLLFHAANVTASGIVLGECMFVFFLQLQCSESPFSEPNSPLASPHFNPLPETPNNSPASSSSATPSALQKQVDLSPARSKPSDRILQLLKAIEVSFSTNSCV